MPLYEYECQTCSHRFEVIQKFSDPLVTECPKCQGAVRKLFSSPAIQFKGSGFYITDYAKKNSTPAGASKGEGSGSGEGTASREGSGSGDKPSGSTSTESAKSTNTTSSSSDAGASKTSSPAKATTTPSS